MVRKAVVVVDNAPTLVDSEGTGEQELLQAELREDQLH